MSESILAWHFVGDKLRNGAPVPHDGALLKYNDSLSVCASGLHASKRIIDALVYAPGDMICRVHCGGEIVHSNDKFVCRERTILWRIDGHLLLRRFASNQALSVKHLWNMPEVVEKYLLTLAPELRSDAWSATQAAAWSDVARSAAQVAVRYAARSAERVTAGSDAWVTAGSAERVTARYAAQAARDAAWYAARPDAWSDAWYAAQAAANKELTNMVMEEHRKTK